MEQEEIYLDKIWARIEAIRIDPFRYRLREDLFSVVALLPKAAMSFSSAPIRKPSKSPVSYTPQWI